VIEIKRLDDVETIVRISSIPEPQQTEFRRWLFGKTLPVIGGTEDRFDWAYAWDWWRFCRQ